MSVHSGHSAKEVSGFVRNSDIDDGRTGKAIKYAVAPKALRLDLIRSDPASEEAQICAAIEIQRFFRGYCARCRFLNTVQPKASQEAVIDKNNAGRMSEVHTPLLAKPSARELLENRYDNDNANRQKKGENLYDFNNFCAKFIQSWWSQKNDEKKSKMSLLPVPAGSPTKARPDSAPKKKIILNESEATTVIQRAWRRHIDIQVYHYYRDLINFKQRGDPMMMLRCINPNEAKLLDAASGVHIKFRLAGDRFPPNIYYKIFTHRPIQDLCANSPKDYTKAEAKRKMARDVHNKGDRIPNPDHNSWYIRAENNGWRLVSDRLLKHILNDPVTWETTNKKMHFHHNKLQRKQDVERKKKSKKIDWMKKMYRDGMLNAKVADEETVRLIEGAAAGMVATIDRQGEEAVQDWEVDELLEWTTSLNFEDYCDAWKENGTSANSEKAVEDRLNIMTSAADPFDISLKVDPHRDGSTRQSHNTPASSHSASSVKIC